MITKQHQKTKRGFTIIEVVLVLAIAGLIFLMVFIALPALQRSQRDTQRRDDMARFASQLAQYQANNKGKVPDVTKPGDWNTFISNYLTVNGQDTFEDPSGSVTYNVKDITDCSTATNCKQKSVAEDVSTGSIHVYYHATCDGETPVQKKGAKNIAFTYKLEGAGVYCGHN